MAPAARLIGIRAGTRTALLSAVATGLAAADVALAQVSRERSQPAPRRASAAGVTAEPTSREAAAWVAEQPQYLPYRLALARALVREGQIGAALRHFESIVTRDSSPALLTEAAAAHAAAGDHDRAAELYRRAVERAPSHTALRSAYARTLVARARQRLRADDDASAVRDLNASVALRPAPEAYTLLGDVYRLRAQFSRARAAYEQAIALRPGDRDATTRLAALARDERPSFGYGAAIDEEPGVMAGAEALTDNAGFAHVRVDVHAGLRLRSATVLGLRVDRRVVNERSVGGAAPRDDAESAPVTGVGATVGLAHELSSEQLDAQVAARVGAARHSAGGSISLFGITAVGTYQGTWSLSLDAAGGPAYAELLALGMTGVTSPLGGDTATETLLSIRSLAVGIVVPLPIVDVAARLERLWVSDGNARSAVEASARFPLGSGLSLLYSGGVTAFRDRSMLYWDPRRDVFHTLGFELGRRSDDGFAFALRALPGVGRTAEGLTPSHLAGPGDTQRLVRQFAAEADVGVQRERWDVALGAALATGRAGGYRQFEGGVRARYVP